MAKRKTNFKKAVQKTVERQNREASSYGYLRLPKGVSVFKEKEGHVYIDIMPYEVTMDKHPDLDKEDGIAEKGSLWYRRPFKTHRGIGSDNETIICPTSIGKPCPICEHKKKRQLEGAEKEELDAFKVSKRNLYAVIPINDKKQDEEPHIYDVSDYLFQQLLNEELSEKEKFNSFPDLDDGFTLDIRYEEKTFAKNKYYAANRIDFETRDAYEESILDDIPKLDNCLNILSYNEINNLFFEMDDEEENETDEKKEKSFDEIVEEPKKTPARRKKIIEKEVVEEETPEPSRRRAPKKEVEKEESKSKCPYGHKFGTELDQHDDCAECESWNECLDASESE